MNAHEIITLVTVFFCFGWFFGYIGDPDAEGGIIFIFLLAVISATVAITLRFAN